MQNADQILKAIRKMGEKGIPLTRIYRCLYSEDLFLLAYDRIGRHQGALTPGTENDTADGMALSTIRKVIQDLRQERFRFRPSRRAYVPKKSGGKRPLGIPNFTDKLVQEVLRLILEAYYEPQFRDSSHGFRTGRGCHTALGLVQRTFRGAAWFIEGDIHGCFDNIDHEKLMEILSRNIQDGRVLGLIRLCLKAGAMEDWTYRPSFSGTPQGGVLSPLLANLYLNELDRFIEDELIPQYTCGESRRVPYEYYRFEAAIARARRQGDLKAVEELQQQRRQVPSTDRNDPAYRRLKYVRYADDFLLAYYGPRHEAESIKNAIGDFLKVKLGLDMNRDKTLITHARSEYAHFLGYTINVYHADDKLTRIKTTKGSVAKRLVNGKIRLGIPLHVFTEYKRRYQHDGKVRSDMMLLHYSDAHIIFTFQQRFQGLAEYYKYAADRRQLASVKHIMQIALVKTLAQKYRTTVGSIFRKYRGKRVVDGREYVTLQLDVLTKTGLRTIYWGAIPLRVVKSITMPIEDTRYREQWVSHRSDLIQRLQAGTCELCGSTVECQVHHVRKLADLKRPGRKEKPAWVKSMIAMHRKTLVVCRKCHTDIHAGRPTPPSRI
jgi:group II intron reverse transcriptase/maturase